MKLNYTVHSVADAPFTITATVNGKDREVSVEGVVVELLSDDSDAAITLRLSDDIEAARKLFVTGGSIVLTFGSK